MESISQDLINRKFFSQIEFEEFIETFQHLTQTTLRRRNSRAYKSDRFPYSLIRYECIHFGKPRSNIKDGSRPRQKSNAIDCKYYFVVGLARNDDEVGEHLLVKNYCLEHNHMVPGVGLNGYSNASPRAKKAKPAAVVVEASAMNEAIHDFNLSPPKNNNDLNLSTPKNNVVVVKQQGGGMNFDNRQMLMKPIVDLHMSYITDLNQMNDQQFVQHLNEYKRFVNEVVVYKLPSSATVEAASVVEMHNTDNDLSVVYANKRGNKRNHLHQIDW